MEYRDVWYVNYEDFKDEYAELKKENKYGQEYKLARVDFGYSDIASVTCRFCSNENGDDNVTVVHFGEDEGYMAHLIDETTKVPAHYSKVAEGYNWLKTYDDEGLVNEIDAPKIEIYRAGSMGVLVRLLGEVE